MADYCTRIGYSPYYERAKRKKKTDRTVLVITDFTKSSTNAVLSAASLFEKLNLKFILLNVFENPAEKSHLLISVEDILVKDSEAGLKKQAAELASTLKGKEVSFTTYSAAGRLKKVVKAIQETENIDLIVVGIPSDKHPFKDLNKIPLLFMGQSKLPVLMVPEKCPDKPAKNAFIINLGAPLSRKAVDKEFEHIVNHDHIAKHIIYFNEKQPNHALHEMLLESESDLMILIPAPGDRLDKALLEYQITTLAPTLASLLKY